MWPNSLGGTSGCSGGAGATDLGGLTASTTSGSELFGPAAFGASAAGPYGALKTNPYVSALGMPPIEALHSTIGYPGCTPAGESYYCECSLSYTTYRRRFYIAERACTLANFTEHLHESPFTFS